MPKSTKQRAAPLAKGVAGKPASPLTARLEAFLTPILRPGQTLLLAFSGGLDSRVLLELLAPLQKVLGFSLRAMHVHHGLSPNADEWADFCKATCARLHIPLKVIKVRIPDDSGIGIEAAARKARYEALGNDAADYIVLAHHEDDQAETLLLQLLRGAGAKGLSAMAMHDASRHLLRPLLDSSRAELLAFARQHDLAWIEDESNQDQAYDRNYCRHHVMPLLQERFPAASHTLARSAAHIAEAAQLLDELAQIDATRHTRDGQLEITGLAALSDARARNLLRWWLSSHRQSLPTAQRLQEMLRQLLSARNDASIKIAVDSANGVWLRRYHGFAYLEFSTASQPIAMLWQGEAELRMPDNSRLLFERCKGGGLAVERLGIDKLRISHRLGGERFKPDLAKPTRTLKHLLQEANIPPWQRERLPLVYCDDILAVVPGIGVACSLQAGPDEVSLVISWQAC